jgi:hypothetical protein
LQPKQYFDGRIGAVIGADKNVVEPERFVVSDPIDDVRALVFHGRDNRVGVFAHLCLMSAAHCTTAIGCALKELSHSRRTVQAAWRHRHGSRKN